MLRVVSDSFAFRRFRMQRALAISVVVPMEFGFGAALGLHRRLMIRIVSRALGIS